MTNAAIAPPSTSRGGGRRVLHARGLRSWMRRSGLSFRDLARLGLFTIALLGLSIASVAIDWGGGGVVLREGDAADRTIKASETVSYVSEIRTQEARDDAYADKRNVVLTHDEQVRTAQLDDAAASLTQVEGLRADRTRPEAARVIDVRAALQDISADEAARLLALEPAAWERVRAEALRLVDTSLANPLQQDQVTTVKEELGRRVSAQLSLEEQALAVAIARPFVRANVFEDKDATQANREQAAARVQPVMVTVVQGQAVVRDGDIVTRYDIEKLEKLGLLSTTLDSETRLGRSGLMAVLTLLLVAYLFRFHRSIWAGRQLLLLMLVLFGPILMARLILPHDEIQYMFPAAAAGLLLAVLLEFGIAAIVSGFLALYLGIVAEMSLELVLLYFLGSLAGAYIIWRAERTMTFVWAGLGIAAVSFAVALCFNLIESEVDSGLAGELLVESLVAGALSASLTFLSFSLLGSMFGITTHLQLLELAHPNQPLLYRLAREAPGTYHHSIVVSNLAESGVEIVGGDPLFTRVAVLYHDVGKIVRPTFFIENQANMENPHDLLDPRVSARVIIDHVIDGARLARKARLPQSMIDIIVQHHGTSLIRYFYARTVEAGEAADEAEFRYPGPKPQTKEAGVIMLADSTEAAVRATAMAGRLASAKGVPRDGAETLDAIVDRIFQERLDDGQLNECDLTFREIEAIKRAFVQILEGIYHPRVEYPSLRVKPAAPAAAATTAAS